jgi:hypothetical protein
MKVLVDVQQSPFDEDYYVSKNGCAIAKVDCIPVSEGKLTEEEASKLYLDLCDVLDIMSENEFKAQLILTGWLPKKSAVDELKEYYKYNDKPGFVEFSNIFRKHHELALKAIEEVKHESKM